MLVADGGALPASNATDVPLGAVLAVSFNDFPDHATVFGDAIVLRQGADKVAATLTTDLVDRRVLLRPSASLLAGTDYELEISATVGGLSGLQLGRANGIHFTTGSTSGGGPDAPLKRTMADVQQIFEGYVECSETDKANCGCARIGCHNAVGPAADLKLGNTTTSRQFLVGVLTTEKTDNGKDMMQKMKRVEPREPTQSYLLHKLLSTPLVRGGPMPLDGTLSLDDLRLINDWIAGGAL